MSKLGGVTEEGTVVSNLPLLFADGLPTSLEKITEKQLEKFIILMLNCSASREYNCHDDMPTPKWWPSDIPFSIPLVKPPDVGEWLWMLKNLVTRCYSYHACEFMLTFCYDLANYPVEVLKFVDLCDGTTSLLNKENGRLLVTFRNQNVIYDRKGENSPRKSLLPRGSKSSSGSKPMVQPPPFIDIYLCDSCDAEFETLQEVRDHENICRQEQDQARGQQALRSSTPDDLQSLLSDQVKFLNYFGISSLHNDSSVIASNGSPPSSKPCKRKVHGNLGFLRHCPIPVSSELGLHLQKKMARAPYVVPQSHMDRIERYCLPAKKESKTSWAHVYKNAPKKSSSEWAHTYTFSKHQRLDKYEGLKMGLSERSMCLLKQCQEVYVVIPRFTKEELEELLYPVCVLRLPMAKRKQCPPSSEVQCKEIPVIDLCSSDDEDSDVRMSSSSTDSKSDIVCAESASKIEESCSSQFSYNENVTLRSPLPIKYPNASLSVNNLNKPTTLRKRMRRGRRSLASENEVIPPREQKKYFRTSFPLEGKSKLQELNQINESTDTNLKEWNLSYTMTQPNHNGKKFSTGV